MKAKLLTKSKGTIIAVGYIKRKEKTFMQI